MGSDKHGLIIETAIGPHRGWAETRLRDPLDITFRVRTSRRGSLAANQVALVAAAIMVPFVEADDNASMPRVYNFEGYADVVIEHSIEMLAGTLRNEIMKVLFERVTAALDAIDAVVARSPS